MGQWDNPVCHGTIPVTLRCRNVHGVSAIDLGALLGMLAAMSL